jgi:Lrp/AsnC family leucine-responsive transcriptional regulator
MVKIDLKDRKILYHLDSNARQSNTQIGKKVGLKKDVVSYRIKKLQEGGVIKNFWTVIDAYRLGYIVFRFYIVFQYVTPDVRKKIVEYLVKDKHTWVVASLIGHYDLSVVIWVKDINNFYQFWEKMLDSYGDYFAEKTFSIYVRAYVYKTSYLLDSYDKSDRLYYSRVGAGGKVEIDETDYRLLNEIATNARTPLVDLAEKLGCSAQNVNYRLKNLMKSGVIQAFRTGIDLSKLGFHYYKVDIHLKEHTQRKHMIDYIQYNPNVVYASTSAGISDLELEFHIENEDKLNQTMQEISSNFPGSIRKYSYFTVQDVHKLRCIPELFS